MILTCAGRSSGGWPRSAPDPGPIEAALAADRAAPAACRPPALARSWAPPGAKAAAWERLMQPSALSAYELYATGEGFFDPGQTELTAPYVPRFFAEIGATAAFRSGWSLGNVAAAAYPWSAATAETLELAEQALATDLAAPVRRALVDGTDQLRRAVRSMTRFVIGGARSDDGG